MKGAEWHGAGVEPFLAAKRRRWAQYIERQREMTRKYAESSNQVDVSMQKKSLKPLLSILFGRRSLLFS